MIDSKALNVIPNEYHRGASRAYSFKDALDQLFKKILYKIKL